jgi:hypothetical protein
VQTFLGDIELPFFNKFPTVAYDITRGQFSNYENVTNIFFRLAMVREAVNNISAYYEYTIHDGDTPEILAEKVYGDPEAHWVILMANNIVDPQYDWPLDKPSFLNYIRNKYDLISLAKTQTHHYEKVIKREESRSGIITETRFRIDLRPQVEDLDAIDVPYESYEGLPETQSVEVFDMGDGSTVVQTTYRERITNWDWEVEQNENKRHIKIIKKEYYGRILAEFDNHLKNADKPFLRRFTQ